MNRPEILPPLQRTGSARTDGRAAFEGGLCVARSNPYRPGTCAYAAFVAGYEAECQRWLRRPVQLRLPMHPLPHLAGHP